MNATDSILRLGSRFGVLMLIAGAILWGIYHYGDKIGLNTLQAKLYFCLGLGILILLFRYGGRIVQFILGRHLKGQGAPLTSGQHLKPASQSHRAVIEMRQTLRRQYGRFGAGKMTILMLTGSVADVERLAPGLSSQYWQENGDTLLLWGGEPQSASDNDWLFALRKRFCPPVNGLVWVTSAFDHLPAANQHVSPALLSMEDIDNIAHDLAERFSLLGWAVPLYVWSLHPQADDQAGRIVQSVGSLFPPDCQSSQMRQLLSALPSRLLETGVQQVTGNPQHHFLLGLADQLTRQPERISVPLSTFLEPHRALPLAGVVFSPSSPQASHSLKHHWRHDKRWDVLLESLRPSGLKARKIGFPWRRAVSASTAALMLLWAASMTVSFIANRHLVAIAQEQVRLASAEKQPLAVRLHALSALQKTLSQLEYRSQHGARGTSALASVRTMTCWRRCSRATERGRSRCCAMRRRIIWKSSSPPSCSSRRTAHCVRR